MSASFLDVDFIPTEDDSIEAEFLEESPRSNIRRVPQQRATAEKTSEPRISMALEDWLDVDHTLHELYNLVEIAIMQRDEARDATHDQELRGQVLASRLKEWKTYAKKLERKLHETQLENLQLQHQVQRTVDAADEALQLGPFQRGRKREIRDRLVGVLDSLHD